MVASRTHIVILSKRARHPEEMLPKKKVGAISLSDNLTTLVRTFLVLLEELGLS
jgi:hypothetical protein